MNNQEIKMGGCYKTDEGWLIVGIKKGKTYQTQDIIIDEGGYDEEIADMTEDKIRKIANLTICYRPYYHKQKGLYKVWDETKNKNNEMILQKI
jgi:hypothetical protein